MLKKELRRIYGHNRKHLSDDDYCEYSNRMVNLFRTIELENISNVLTYAPILQKQEFDVSLIDQQLQNSIPTLVLSWPKIQQETNTFEAYKLNPLYGFIENEYQIKEPLNGFKIDPEHLDIVLVPLLIFNLQGFRVGYGKGYYDRFLSLCRPNVIKIGFSFFEPVAAIDDIHHFDVPLNYCITPTEVYEF